MEATLIQQLHEKNNSSWGLPTKNGEKNKLLGFLRNRQSTNWQRSVHSTAGGRRLVIEGASPTPDPNFPWATLQQHTDIYLSKKKRESAEQIEARLVRFIKRSGDRIDISIAACGHKLQWKTLKGLLSADLNVGGDNNVSLETYLQAIVAANRVNASSVSDFEAHLAISLIAAASAGTISLGHYLRALIQILIEGVHMTNLIYPHINILVKKACVDFALQLQSLKANGLLRQAYYASMWLSHVSDQSVNLSPEYLDHEQLLDTFFPAWYSWATWQPDEQRLRRWEDGFTAVERVALGCLLEFEGPDVGGRQATFKEGAIAQSSIILLSTPIRIGRVDFDAQLAIEARPTLERLLKILDATCGAGSAEVALLIHLLVGKTVTLSSFHTLENVRARGDSKITSLLLQVYGTKGEPRSAQLAAGRNNYGKSPHTIS